MAQRSCLERPKSAKNGNKWQDYKYETKTNGSESYNRGLVWDSIVENLNLIETPGFGLKDKRSVRDRWTLLKTKYKKETREEEAASGIDVDDLTERERV